MQNGKCLLLILPLLLPMLSGCAGYRGGWESVAYIGTAPPATTAETVDAPIQRQPLILPGLQMVVALDNQLRTYDTQVYLFAVPLSVDPRNVYPKNNVPGKTRLFVTVTPAEPGFVFRPALASLSFSGQNFPGIAGFEFGMWNQAGESVKAGGKWEHRPVGPEFVLAEAGRTYYLSIDFATPVPSPEASDIVVDLSRTLVSQRHPAIPPIRFMPARWKDSYS